MDLALALNASVVVQSIEFHIEHIEYGYKLVNYFAITTNPANVERVIRVYIHCEFVG